MKCVVKLTQVLFHSQYGLYWRARWYRWGGVPVWPLGAWSKQFPSILKAVWQDYWEPYKVVRLSLSTSNTLLRCSSRRSSPILCKSSTQGECEFIFILYDSLPVGPWWWCDVSWDGHDPCALFRMQKEKPDYYKMRRKAKKRLTRSVLRNR